MFAIAAVDDGPRLSLEPLAMYLGIPMPGPREIPDVGRWRTYLATGEVRGLVSGTSNSLQGVAFEADARSAATNLRLPVVVLEDYPGNYRSVDGARAISAAATLSTIRSEVRARGSVRRCHAPKR